MNVPTLKEMTDYMALAMLVLQALVVWFAYKAIEKHETTAKKRAIVDLIIKQREDERLSNIYLKIYSLLKSHKRVSEECRNDKEFENDIFYALDTLEFIAVGIRLGAFDEDVYKQLQCSKVINTWNSVAALVMDLREEKKSSTLYQDIEQLAERWKANPLKELKTSTYKKVR